MGEGTYLGLLQLRPAPRFSTMRVCSAILVRPGGAAEVDALDATKAAAHERMDTDTDTEVLDMLMTPSDRAGLLTHVVL